MDFGLVRGLTMSRKKNQSTFGLKDKEKYPHQSLMAEFLTMLPRKSSFQTYHFSFFMTKTSCLFFWFIISIIISEASFGNATSEQRQNALARWGFLICRGRVNSLAGLLPQVSRLESLKFSHLLVLLFDFFKQYPHTHTHIM